MSINWGLGLTLLSVYLLLGKSSIILALLLNGFVTSFTRYHILGILAGLTFMLFSLSELLWIKMLFLSIAFIKNYDMLMSWYKLGKKMLNTTDQIQQLDVNNDDIEMMISIKNKISWAELKYEIMQNKYDTLKTNTFEYFKLVKQSSLWYDVLKLYNNFNICGNIVFKSILSNGKYFSELITELPIFNLIFRCIQSYYKSGNKIYEICTTSDENLFGKQTHEFIDIDKVLIADSPKSTFIDLPEQKKKQKNLKKRNPEEIMNEMSKMLDMMESIGKMTLPPAFNLQSDKNIFPSIDLRTMQDVNKEMSASILNQIVSSDNKAVETDNFNDIMNELSVIAEKAENINNSKIMLKKKGNKHKKKRTLLTK